MGMDLKDVGQRFLSRGGAIRGDGDRLATIGRALLEIEKGPVPGRATGMGIPHEVLLEIERRWREVSALLSERLVEEAVEISRRWPQQEAADGLTEV